MELTQLRLPKKILKEINQLVKEGTYNNKSEVMREAIRRFLFRIQLNRMIGSIPNTGNSVKEVRKIRKMLSKEIKTWKDLDEINNL